MSAFRIVFAAELRRRLRSRAFQLSTIFGMVGVGIAILLPGILQNSIDTSTRAVVLAGPAALTGAARTLLAKDFTVAGTVPSLPDPVTTQWLHRYRANAAVGLAAGANGRLKIDLYLTDLGTVDHRMTRDLLPLGIALRTHVGIAEVGDTLNVVVATHGVETRFADENQAQAAQLVDFGLLMFLYITAILNGSAVGLSVVEEKTSRTAELLVAAVSPATLLSAKIAALGVAGACQLLLWLGATVAVARYVAGAAADSVLASLRPEVAVLFVVFLVIGYLQYATLIAGASALVNRTEDSSTVTIPLYVPLICALLVAQYATFSPSSPISVVTSMIPVLSPYVMFIRVATTNVPLWQLVLAIALDLAVLVPIAIAAGKLYRVGLLSFGRPPTLSQMWRTIVQRS